MKRRLLFVEDNPVMLQLYAVMLEDEPDWEVATADSGEAALPLLATGTFDVIVSDLNMPGMDGLQLIAEVRKRSPRTSRIIISGLDDQKKVAECLDETHQFIPKPFSAKTLKATLDRICGLDAYLHDEKLRAVVAQLGTLPSFPSLYLEIMQALSAEDPSLEAVAAIVAKDPAMTAKMLQIVNSTAFGLAQRVTTPFLAVQYVGMGTVRSLALSMHIFSCFERTELKGFAIPELWDHALRTAALARTILMRERVEVAVAEDAYTAALLHDVGKLMLANNLPESFQRVLNLAAQKRIPLHEAEREIFSATHADVGAYLLGLWGLPTTIVEAVAFHHAPGRSQSAALGPLAVVHVANFLEHEISGDKDQTGDAKMDADYLARVGVDGRVDAWRAIAAKQLASPED
jgi:putative nucleotidyltransferase with HDIG domain